MSSFGLIREGPGLLVPDLVSMTGRTSGVFRTLGLEGGEARNKRGEVSDEDEYDR
jgi:hypothetical protein